MPEFKRVYDKALKRKYSVPADAVVEDGLELLEGEDAVDHNGERLEDEFDVTKSGQASASASGQQAESKEK